MDRDRVHERTGSPRRFESRSGQRAGFDRYIIKINVVHAIAIPIVEGTKADSDRLTGIGAQVVGHEGSVGGVRLAPHQDFQQLALRIQQETLLPIPLVQARKKRSPEGQGDLVCARLARSGRHSDAQVRRICRVTGPPLAISCI